MVLRKLRSETDPIDHWQSGKYIETPVRTDEWRDQKLLGEYFFDCIEQLEAAGMYATVDEESESLTCMDYILHRAARKKSAKRRASHKSRSNLKTSLKSMDIIVFPDSYHGSNAGIRRNLAQDNYPDDVSSAHDKKESYSYATSGGKSKKLTVVDQIHTDHALHGTKGEDITAFMRRYYGMRYNLLTAIAEFYFKNPNANPELSHCSSVTEDPNLGWVNTPVNCLTQFIEADWIATLRGNKISRFVNYIATVPFINLINSGTECGLYSHTTYNKVDIHKKTSCLDVALSREYAQVDSVGNHTIFSSVMPSFDMSLECVDPSGELGSVPCIQRIVDSRGSHNFLKILNGTHLAPFMDRILLKTYKFKNLFGGIEETTVIDRIMNTGENLDVILGYPNIENLLTEDVYCKSPDATEIGRDPNITCIEKLLVNLREGRFEKVDVDDIYDKVEKIGTKLSNYIAFSNCWDGKVSTGCTSYLIDIISKDDRLGGILYNILENRPISDLNCADMTIDEPRATNCLDKLIGVSTGSLMSHIVDSGTIIDTMDCRDWNNLPMNCIDKLFQRHEMWIYNENLGNELTGLLKSGDNMGEIEQEISDLGFEAKIHRVTEDPGFSSISSQYDLGMKVHSPSKAFSGFADVIANQIARHRDTGGDRNKINYLRELLTSVASDKPSREVAIVSRIYKILDAFFPTISKSNVEDFEMSGFWGLVMERSIPSSFNMFECKDDQNRTISCIQKQIEETKKYCGAYAHGCGEAVASVMEMKDLFKDGMCTDYSKSESGEKMPCLVYAFSELPNYIGTELYTLILSRGDFGKTRDFMVNLGKGTVPLSDLICSHVSIEQISSLLDKQHKFTEAEIKAVQNSSPSHDGAAFKLYANCLCRGITDPMERRICLDTQCFREYVRGSSGSKNWAVNFLSMDNSSDAYYHKGSGVVKDLTPDKTRDAYYPYIYNGSPDYFGMSGVYNLEFNPADYHITNIERTDAAGKVTSVFNLEDALTKLYKSALRIKGKTITMAIPEIDNDGVYVLDDKRRIKEFRGKATIEAIYLNSPSDPSGEYEFVIKFSHLDDRFKSGNYSWTVNYPAIEAFGVKGIFGRSDLKDIIIKYVKDRELVKQLSTRQKAAEGKTSLKLVISNRPADFMRASTCQSWRSCLHSDLLGSGFNSNALPQYIGAGAYVAYIANDEFSPTWYARAFMLPLMAKATNDPTRTKRWMENNYDFNNNFRVPKVYGATSHKILLEDALSQILRSKGYNTNHLVSGDTSWYITDDSVKRQTEDLRQTALREAYDNCLNKPPVMPEFITSPSGTTITLPECGQFLLSRGSTGSTDYGHTIEIAHNLGLMSERTYNRTLAIPLWRKYNEAYNAIAGKISDTDLSISKRGGNTQVMYLKPLTVPA